LIGRSCRVSIAEGSEILKNLISEKTPVAFCFWHNRIFYLSYYLFTNIHQKGMKLTVLVSKSKDGEIIARIIEKNGARAVRGSSSKGGFAAVKSLLRRVREGYSLVITPDGPRGPVYRFQPGAVYIASYGKIPIVPVSCSFENAWGFKSWDRFMVPKPFSKIRIFIKDPVMVPSKIKPEDVKKIQDQLSEVLSDVPELTSGPVFVDGEKNGGR